MTVSDKPIADDTSTGPYHDLEQGAEGRILREQFEAFFQQSPFSIVLIDLQAKVIGFNQTTLTQYEYPPEEMLELTIPQFEVIENPEEIQKHAATIAKTGQDDFVTQHRTKSGKILDIHASVRLVETPGGPPIFQCIFQDITQQRRWERSLLENEERLQLALESAEEGLWDWDLTSATIEVSPWWTRMLGIAATESSVTLKDWESLCHPEDLPVAQKQLQAMLDGAVAHYALEHRLRHKNGHYVWVLGKAKVVQWGKEGEPLRVVGINLDISERKRSEQALLQETLKNAGLFRAAHDGLHIIDEHGFLVQAGGSFERMLGYEPGEMAGMHVSDWDVAIPREVDFACLLGRFDPEGGFLEARQRRKDGTIIDVEINVVVVRIDECRYAYASQRDVTKRKLGEQKLREQEAALRSILDNLPYMVWLKDTQGRYIAANRPFLETAGKEQLGEVLGRTTEEVWPSDRVDRFLEADRQVIENKDKYFVEQPVLEHGATVWYETFKTPIVDERGEVLGTTGYARNITARKQAEESLQLAAMIYRESGEAILVTDAANHIIDVNPAFTQITGYTLDEVVGKDPKVLSSGRHDKAFYRTMWHAILNQGHWQGEIWDRRKDGSLYAKWTSISLIRNPDGTPFRHVALFSDITEKKQMDDLIWRQANYDGLTGLPNRRLFRDRLDQELRQERRRGHKLAVLFIDLDRFKEINDTLGHSKGDLLLGEAARRIGKCVREGDIVARLGGDEFTVVLPDVRQTVHVEPIVRSILHTLRAPYDLDGEEGYVSASIGITFFPDDARHSEDLLKNADQAMYVAKGAGRDRFSYYTESMQRDAMARIGLINDLRHALVHGELEVYYQPIVNLRDGSIAKAEALMRWRHPQRGWVEPSIFIPLAEEAGLIREIGDWMFDQVASQILRWHELWGRWIQVSVNKSPAQFIDDPNGCDWIAEMTKWGLPGEAITVEITEGLLLHASPHIKRLLLQMRDVGVEVSIDDFGTGFSALSYLKKFDIDYLKIDRSFISSLAEDASDRTLTEAIIGMAHKLGIKTVAEGVETQEQRDVLIEFG